MNYYSRFALDSVETTICLNQLKPSIQGYIKEMFSLLMTYDEIKELSDNVIQSVSRRLELSTDLLSELEGHCPYTEKRIRNTFLNKGNDSDFVALVAKICIERFLKDLNYRSYLDEPLSSIQKVALCEENFEGAIHEEF